MAGRMKAPARGVAVRMYRGFFGDCFLIAFRKTDKTTAYMLIDCGDWNQRKDVLIPIAEDIEKATGGKLDVIVATHEHSDHLSGFNVAREVFDRMEVGQIWLSWLDDPTSTLAHRLKKAYGKKQAAVRVALDRWQQAAQGLSAAKRDRIIERIDGIRAVLAFDDAHENLAAAGKPTIADAIKYLKGKGKEEPHYCHPGEPPTFTFRGGATLLIDQAGRRLRYCISKRMQARDRLERQRVYMRGDTDRSLRSMYFHGKDGDEPFAALHRSRDELADELRRRARRKSANRRGGE